MAKTDPSPSVEIVLARGTILATPPTPDGRVRLCWSYAVVGCTHATRSRHGAHTRLREAETCAAAVLAQDGAA